MNEPLLWDLEETARQLNVCMRTVRRLIMRGDFPAVRVGRCVRVPVDAVRAYVERNMQPAHNTRCAEPGVREKEVYACHTDAMTVPSIGSVTQARAVRELAGC